MLMAPAFLKKMFFLWVHGGPPTPAGLKKLYLALDLKRKKEKKKKEKSQKKEPTREMLAAAALVRRGETKRSRPRSERKGPLHDGSKTMAPTRAPVRVLPGYPNVDYSGIGSGKASSNVGPSSSIGGTGSGAGSRGYFHGHATANPETQRMAYPPQMSERSAHERSDYFGIGSGKASSNVGPSSSIGGTGLIPVPIPDFHGHDTPNPETQRMTYPLQGSERSLPQHSVHASGGFTERGGDSVANTAQLRIPDLQHTNRLLHDGDRGGIGGVSGSVGSGVAGSVSPASGPTLRLKLQLTGGHDGIPGGAHGSSVKGTPVTASSNYRIVVVHSDAEGGALALAKWYAEIEMQKEAETELVKVSDFQERLRQAISVQRPQKETRFVFSLDVHEAGGVHDVLQSLSVDDIKNKKVKLQYLHSYAYDNWYQATIVPPGLFTSDGTGVLVGSIPRPIARGAVEDYTVKLVTLDPVEASDELPITYMDLTSGFPYVKKHGVYHEAIEKAVTALNGTGRPQRIFTKERYVGTGALKEAMEREPYSNEPGMLLIDITADDGPDQVDRVKVDKDVVAYIIDRWMGKDDTSTSFKWRSIMIIGLDNGLRTSILVNDVAVPFGVVRYYHDLYGFQHTYELFDSPGGNGGDHLTETRARNSVLRDALENEAMMEELSREVGLNPQQEGAGGNRTQADKECIVLFKAEMERLQKEVKYPGKGPDTDKILRFLVNRAIRRLAEPSCKLAGSKPDKLAPYVNRAADIVLKRCVERAKQLSAEAESLKRHVYEDNVMTELEKKVRAEQTNEARRVLMDAHVAEIKSKRVTGLTRGQAIAMGKSRRVQSDAQALFDEIKKKADDQIADVTRDVLKSVISDAKSDEVKERRLAKREANRATKAKKEESAKARIANNTAADKKGEIKRWDTEFFDSIRSKVAADTDSKQIGQEHVSVIQGIVNGTYTDMREYARKNGLSGGATAAMIYEQIKARAISIIQENQEKERAKADAEKENQREQERLNRENTQLELAVAEKNKAVLAAIRIQYMARRRSASKKYEADKARREKEKREAERREAERAEAERRDKGGGVVSGIMGSISGLFGGASGSAGPAKAQAEPEVQAKPKAYVLVNSTKSPPDTGNKTPDEIVAQYKLMNKEPKKSIIPNGYEPSVVGKYEYIANIDDPSAIIVIIDKEEGKKLGNKETFLPFCKCIYIADGSSDNRLTKNGYAYQKGGDITIRGTKTITYKKYDLSHINASWVTEADCNDKVGTKRADLTRAILSEVFHEKRKIGLKPLDPNVGDLRALGYLVAYCDAPSEKLIQLINQNSGPRRVIVLSKVDESKADPFPRFRELTLSEKLPTYLYSIFHQVTKDTLKTDQKFSGHLKGGNVVCDVFLHKELEPKRLSRFGVSRAVTRGGAPRVVMRRFV